MPLIGTKNLGGNTRRLRYALLHTELVAAATTQTVSLGTLPAGAMVQSVVVDLQDTFDDAGSISNVTLQVGSTADPNSFFTALEVMASTPTEAKYEQRGVWESGNSLAVKLLATATGANFGDGTDTDLDAGRAIVDVVYTYGA
jgi:hypothetical protein